jgi:glycosyltransferase involved in cell wall biosynthesis
MSLRKSDNSTEPELSVAIIEPVAGHGGMHCYDFGLCRGLLSAGCRVSLYTCDETPNPCIPGLGFYPFYQHIYGSRTRWLRGLFFLRSTLRSIRHIVNSGAALCHFHSFDNPITDLAIIAVARLFTKSVVLTVHDVDSLARGRAGRVRVVRWTYRLADRVIAHNRVSANELESIGVRPCKIAIIPHGHYLESMREMPSMANARCAMAIDPSAKVVLFFGQIKHSKGLDLLIEALPQLAHQFPEIVLLIAGRPWKTNFARYDGLIDRMNVREHCHLRIRYIPDEDVAELYAAADLVVLPYRRIYQSGVLLMAMTYERPVVVSDLPGMCEIVADGVNGYVFEGNSKDELVKVLIRAFSDEAGRQQIVARASNYIRQYHDWNRIGAKTLDVYRQALSGRNAHPA